MSFKKEDICNFLSLLHKLNCNSVSGNNSYTEVFGKGKPFAIICQKCSSMDIDVIGERGIDYGGITGYSEGSTVVKCNGCGNAITVWE